MTSEVSYQRAYQSEQSLNTSTPIALKPLLTTAYLTVVFTAREVHSHSLDDRPGGWTKSLTARRSLRGCVSKPSATMVRINFRFVNKINIVLMFMLSRDGHVYEGQ